MQLESKRQQEEKSLKSIMGKAKIDMNQNVDRQMLMVETRNRAKIMQTRVSIEALKDHFGNKENYNI